MPLASGLLSGRYTADTVFAADDHRTYNRHGEAFDVGETFSGVDYPTGVRAAAEFAAIAAEPGAYTVDPRRRGDHRPGRAALGDAAAGRHHRHPRRP